MGRYATEPDNATKAAKARGSNLRVHFKVCKDIYHFHNVKTLSYVRKKLLMASNIISGATTLW